MANVTIAGATYSDVPAIQVPSGSGTALFYETKDVTYNLTGGASASVTPSEVVAGQGFSLKLKVPSGYSLSGVTVTMGGTDITSSVVSYESSSGGSTPVLQDKSVSYTPTTSAQSATVTADEGYDGLSSVSVSVGAIPSSYISWTKIAETTYTTSTSSTTAATVGTWSTGNSSIWTSNAYILVRIRDTAGARAGYFFGSDTFFCNYLPANGSSTTSLSAGTVGMAYRYTTSSTFASRYDYGTTGYGVYADTIYSDGRIRIRSRYNSSYSLTVDGTYKVECYMLTTPDGNSIFS